MLKRLIPLALVLGLAGCDTRSNTGADGYQFGERQFARSSVEVSVVTYQSQRDVVAAAKKFGVNNPDVVAFSVLRPPFDKCTIHMVDPSVKYMPEFIGHEFAHCLYGQWHTSNEARS